jgi:hypothetical protein
MLGFGAISEVAISAVPDALRVTFAGVVTYDATESDDVSIWAASEEYISRLSDTPAGQPMRGTLDRLPQFDRTIIGGDGFSGLTNGWGDVALINAEGNYDGFIEDYAVDGREVIFYAGDPSGAFSGFFEVAKVVAKDLTVDEQFLTVSLQDKSFLLDVPTQPNVYQGTGDLEGGTELKGKRKPLAFGRVNNATPVLLISSELVFQINDGAVSTISAVYDQAYPLTATTDYATPALLRAATIAAGSYATCVAYGLFRLGGSAQRVTCDTHGDATNSGYVETTGTIIRRIVALTGCLTDPDDIDTISFANLETAQPAPISYFLGADSTETVAETFDKLSKGIGAFIGFTRLGMLQCSVFSAPVGTPAARYSDLDLIGNIEVERLPSGFDPPPWRVRASWDVNWTVIDDPIPGWRRSTPIASHGCARHRVSWRRRTRACWTIICRRATRTCGSATSRWRQTHWPS